MYIPFENMPDEARVWIYPSNRKWSEAEAQSIDAAVKQFVEQWNAHSTPLEASYELRYDRFIVLAVNSAVQPASGCSIDSSVHFIQQLEQQYDISLLDKMNVTFRTGEYIAHKTLVDFKKMAKEKAVTENTIVFNNLVNTVGEYKEFWEVPAGDSWHSRFF